MIKDKKGTYIHIKFFLYIPYTYKKYIHSFFYIHIYIYIYIYIYVYKKELNIRECALQIEREKGEKKERDESCEQWV